MEKQRPICVCACEWEIHICAALHDTVGDGVSVI